MKKHIIINVGRQLGSGGRIIGNRIAEDFNIKFYDKELLDLAAKESGFNKKFFERNDEHKGFLKVLFSSFAPIFGNSDPYANQRIAFQISKRRNPQGGRTGFLCVRRKMRRLHFARLP